jgi:hypothetical protein
MMNQRRSVPNESEEPMMEKIATSFGLIVISVAGIFAFVVFGTALGAIAGWIVGLFFGETILGILSQFGVRNITMWQFGAFMGFVGGFLKTKVTA